MKLKQYGPSADILQNIPNIDRVRKIANFLYFLIIFQSFIQNHDPLAEHRRPTIADRENEYQQKRRMIPGMISPERLDYFADGKYMQRLFYFFSIRFSV